MAQQNFTAVFPEGLSTLHQADPEVFSIIRDEEERQWCATEPRKIRWKILFLVKKLADEAAAFSSIHEYLYNQQ